MATFKAVVNPYRRDDGTYRVSIRVTHNRVTRYIPTPFYLRPEQMTRRLKIKDQSVLDKIEDKVREYRDKTNELGFFIDNISIDHLLSLIQTSSSNLDFFEYSDTFIQDLEESGRDSTAKIYRSACDSLRRFNENMPLPFSNIDSKYIERYFDSLSNLKANTQRMYIGKLSTIYKSAQRKYNDQNAGIVLIKYGVFDTIKLPTREASKNNAFKTIEQMQTFIDMPYGPSWGYEFAKDMFILSFVCFGTNFADLMNMEKSQYKDGILYYRRKKTGRRSKDNADMQVKVPEVGRIIINKYAGDTKYLINFGQHARNYKFSRFIHYYFAKMGLEDMPKKMGDIGDYRGNYTFYANRHTMASFARNICGIDYMTVHEMLNHTAPSSFKTTDVYLWKDFTHLWEANEKLMALFDWSFYTKQKGQSGNCPHNKIN